MDEQLKEVWVSMHALADRLDELEKQLEYYRGEVDGKPQPAAKEYSSIPRGKGYLHAMNKLAQRGYRFVACLEGGMILLEREVPKGFPND